MSNDAGAIIVGFCLLGGIGVGIATGSIGWAIAGTVFLLAIWRRD